MSKKHISIKVNPIETLRRASVEQHKRFLSGDWKVSQSTHPKPRSRKVQARRKKNHENNRAIRAAHYAQFKGELGNKNVAQWHSVLNALSRGAAG